MTRWTGSKWLWRSGAVLVVIFQQILIHQALPLEDRWFLHPDDHSVYRFGRAIVETGAPRLEYEDLPLANVSEWPVVQGGSGFQSGNAVSGRAPIGIYYVLAIPANQGPTAIFVAAIVLGVLSLAVFFAFAERFLGGPGALVATAAFSFSASTMFWSSMAMSNLPGLALLFAGLLGLMSKRTWIRALGAGLLALTILFRYEYLILIAILAASWLLKRLVDRTLFTRTTGMVLAAAGIATTLALGLLYLAYHTTDFVGVAQGTTDQSSVEEALGTASGASFRLNLATFGIVVLPFLVCLTTLSLFRPLAPWPLLPLAGGCLVLFAYFFSHQFTGNQPVLLFYSQTRYMLPLIAVGSLALGRLFAATPRFSIKAVVMATVFCLAASGASIALGPQGLGGARDYMAVANKHVAVADELPTDTVFLGDRIEKILITQPMIVPSKIPDPERRNETARIAESLLDAGYTIALSRSFNTFYRTWLLEDVPGIDIQEDPEGIYWLVSQRGP